MSTGKHDVGTLQVHVIQQQPLETVSVCSLFRLLHPVLPSVGLSVRLSVVISIASIDDYTFRPWTVNACRRWDILVVTYVP